MEISKRKKFLNHFLKLFDAKNIEWLGFEKNRIGGNIFYSDNSQQEFCWYMTEENVPSDEVIDLINVLKENNFIDSDKLNASLETIFSKTKQTDFQNFKKNIDGLLNVKIQMIDNGEETDFYFLHNS